MRTMTVSVAALALLITGCESEDEAAALTAELVTEAQQRGFYVVSAYDRHDYVIVSFGGCEGVLEFDQQGVPVLRNIIDWDGPEEWERFTIPDPQADDVLDMNRFRYCG